MTKQPILRFYFTLSGILFALTFLFAQSISDYLQADYHFNGGSLIDESHNMIEGTGYNLSSANGLEKTTNSAFLFNGLSSYIDCGADDRNITDQVTLSAWIKTTSFERQIIVSKYHVEDDGGYFLGMNEGLASIGGRDGSDTFFEITSASLRVDDGAWHHIVGVIDRNTWKLYVDCQMVNELTTSTETPQYNIPDPLTIGKLSVGTNLGEQRYFDGVIDNVKVYNAALNENQLIEISEYSCPVSDIDPRRPLIKRLFGNEPLGPRTAIELPNHELLIAGEVQINGSVTGTLLTRCTQEGEIIWARRLNASGVETVRGLISTSDGGFAIVGMTTSGDFGAEDVLLIKLDSEGNLLWSKTYGGAGEDRGFGILETSDGHLLIAGSTGSFGSGSRDAFLLKTNLDGEMIWSKAYGGNGNETFVNIHAVNETTFILYGITITYSSGIHDNWLVTVDDQGSVASANAYGDTGDDLPMMFEKTEDGGNVVVGHSTFWGFGGYDGFVFKTDASGAVQWAKVFGGSGTDFLRGLMVDHDQNIFISGITQSAGAGLNDLFLVGLSPDGSLKEARTFGKSGNDDILWVGQNSLVELPNKRLLMLGALDEMGNMEGLSFNLPYNNEDLCIGEDWPLGFGNIALNAKPVLPNETFPNANVINEKDLLFASNGFGLFSDFLTSDFCPVDLVITPHFTPCSYQASHNITTSGLVNIRAPTTFRAGNSIRLVPGFSVKEGINFSGYIEACNEQNNLMARVEELEVRDSMRFTQSNQIKSPSLKIYPNPAFEQFTIQVVSNRPLAANLWLMNTAGNVVKKIMTDQSLNAGQASFEVSVSHLPPGMYYIHFWTPESSCIKKLVIVH